MSLSSKLLQELRSIAGQGGQIWVTDAQRSVCCDVAQADPLAATINELRLETPELATVTVSELEAASRNLAARVNYLLEPIAPVETDAQGCTVQMRSNPPQHDDNGYRYYELLLRCGGSVALCRYEKPPGQPRVCIAAALTHEVISRLVDDFSTTVDAL